MICQFSTVEVNFVFLLIMNCIKRFPTYKILILIIIVFWLVLLGRPDFAFVAALLLSTLSPLFLPSSSVSLYNFILAAHMLECLGKHSCISSSFPIILLNGTFFFLFGATETKHA